ncbi:MAG: hypothetical protein D6685_13920 [Bacteroidetes bacterium]|nr:MAG: hypothetical protein D6685_13920 [Bacteroidota bacterium]
MPSTSTSRPRRRTTPAATAPPAGEVWTLPEPMLLGLTLLVAAAYVAYSFFSDGFYQHDEAAHYLNMRAFWHDPNVILGNWPKPGYKLLFVLPALLGPMALTVVNALVAAFTGYLAYKLAEAVGARVPLFAFVLLVAQPLWVQLSFRNYSEPISALLLTLAILLHYRDRRGIAALVLSYTVMIRQEFYPLLGLYGLWLLWQREGRAALALLVFPVVNHVWGWMATGDPLYLYTQIVGTSGTYQNAYARQGFEHYFVMALTIFGAVALTLFIVYLAQAVLYRQRVHGFILVPLAVYFLEHSVFQIESIPIGPSTGGNLRYLIVIAPLVAVLGGLAAERLPTLKPRAKLLAVLGPFVLAVLAFLRFAHNNITLTDDPDPVPVVTTLMAVALVFLPLRRRALLGATAAACLVVALLAVRPYTRSAEDAVMAQVAAWYRNSGLDGRPLLANHTMFYYFYGRPRQDFEPEARWITGTAVREAPPGTVILWDSHYSYRPRLREDQVPHTYFLERPQQFRPLFDPIVTPDGRFGVLAFEKTAETPADSMNAPRP